MTEPRKATKPRSALVELTLARFRLFFREPSALFWTFGFPVILAVALGIAFRNRPPEPVRVAIEAGPGAERMLAELASDEVKATVEDDGDRAREAAGRQGRRSSSSPAPRARTATTRHAPRPASRACSSTIASSAPRGAPTPRASPTSG